MAFNEQSPLQRLARHPPTLEGGVELRIEPFDDTHAELVARHGRHRLRLRAAWLSVPYPSGLKRLLAADPRVQAVLVDRAPPGLDAAARELGLGYLDRHGRGRLVGPGFVYVASPRLELARMLGTSRRSPFAPRASRVVRALLEEPSEAWRLSDLAALVGLNPGNVHRVLRTLQEDGYLERDGDRYLLTDPGSLLEAWADAGARPREQIAVPVGGPLRDAVLRTVEQLDGKAVVSGELAAELLVPSLPAGSAVLHCLDAAAWDRLRATIRPSAPSLRAALWGEPLVVNLADEGVAQFSEKVDALALVSPQQLYVDLVRAPGRGREAAEAIRRRRLGY